MMLVKFGGDLMYDVDGLSPSDRYDLEAADKRLKGIENRYGRWSSFVVVIVGVFFLIGIMNSTLDTFWSSGAKGAALGCLPATLTAWFVARLSRQKTLEDVGKIETILRTKKDSACTAFIRERVFRSPLLARTLEPAFNNVTVPMPPAAP